jgi:hypothetical protein
MDTMITGTMLADDNAEESPATWIPSRGESVDRKAESSSSDTSFSSI